jgi:predicted secreted protein
MSDDLKNILSNLNNDIEQDKLLDYLNRQLSEKEQHELEQQLNDDPFMSDALDGLADLHPKADVSAMVQELNSGLNRQLRKKKKTKKFFNQDNSIYFSIALILLLVVIGYIVVKMFLKN